MVRCPNCNDELGAATHCKQCGTTVQTNGPQQPPGRGQQEHSRSQQGQPRGQQTPASPPGQRSQQSRAGGPPGGLKLISLLLGLTGVSLLFGAVTLHSVTQRAAAYGAVAGTAPAGGSLLADLALVCAGIGVASLVAAYGLWTRRSWGWKLGMTVLVVNTCWGLLVLTSGPTMLGLVDTLVAAGGAWYLYNHRWAFAEQGHHAQPTQQPGHQHSETRNAQSQQYWQQ